MTIEAVSVGSTTSCHALPLDSLEAGDYVRKNVIGHDRSGADTNMDFATLQLFKKLGLPLCRKRQAALLPCEAQFLLRQ